MIFPISFGQSPESAVMISSFPKAIRIFRLRSEGYGTKKMLCDVSKLVSNYFFFSFLMFKTFSLFQMVRFSVLFDFQSGGRFFLIEIEAGLELISIGLLSI